MKRTPWPAGLALMLALAAPAAPAGDDPAAAARQELKRLEGTWEQTAAEYRDQKINFPANARPRLVIRGDRFTREAGGKPAGDGTLRVDPGKSPKAIDLIESARPDTINRPGLGIYELNGDELRMCVAVPGLPRPTAFSATAGNRQAIITLRRVKPNG